MPRQTTEPIYIEATLIKSDDPLTKTYGISSDGVPEVCKQPFLCSGTAHRVYIPAASFATELSELLSHLHDHSCLVLGALHDDVVGDFANVTTRERHQPRDPGNGSPIIWRGKDWLGYRAGKPSTLGLDHDVKGIPLDLRERMDAYGGFLSVLYSICPALAAASCVERPSTSTGIVAVDTGATSTGGGSHSYVPITDGGDAADFVGRLHDRLVLEGWGYSFVTEAGVVLIRSLVDTIASGSGERLWFEADAILPDGLEYVVGSRDPVAIPGAMLDTQQALAPLTPDEFARLREICEGLRASVADEAAIKRQSHTERVRKQIVERGEDDASTGDLVERLMNADARGILTGRHLLNLDDGRVASVRDVLDDRAAYHRTTCADPLEPTYGGGTNKAIIYTDGRHPRLFSHAHGGRLFTLALDETDIAAAVTAAQSEGKDATKLVKRIARDVIFSAGGWSQVETATGWQIAEDIGALPVRTIPGSQMTVLPPDGTELAPVVSGQPPAVIEPLDPDPAIALLMREYNERFAVVAEGGTTSVVRLAYNAELHRLMPASMSLDAFKLLYGNRWIEVPSTTAAGVKQVSAAAVWLRHPERRTCPGRFWDRPYRQPSRKLLQSLARLWSRSASGGLV